MHYQHAMYVLTGDTSNYAVPGTSIDPSSGAFRHVVKPFDKT
jgi:hypothetical protein